MMNVLRGVGYVIYGAGFFLKNAILFVFMPWTTGRCWSKTCAYNSDRDFFVFGLPIIYSIASTSVGIMLSVSFGLWYIVLPILAANALSGLYEIGRAYAPPAIPPAETNKENGMNPMETKVDDPSVTSVARNAYEHEINGLRKALDEDEKKVKFWKWLAIGTLSIVVLAGAATGYALHKGILVAEVDGVSLAQELEKAQAELERLKGEIPALQDAQKKLDEMMEKAKEMVPPGILPEKPDKKGDDF